MGKPDTLSHRSDHCSGTSDNENITLLPPELFAVRALEGIVAEGEDQIIMRDIRREAQSANSEDLIAKAARELRSSAAKSMQSSEWSELDGLLLF